MDVFNVHHNDGSINRVLACLSTMCRAKCCARSSGPTAYKTQPTLARALLVGGTGN